MSPILMASLDVIENGCIAVMLWTWPNLPKDGIATNAQRTFSGTGVLRIFPGIVSHHRASPRDTAYSGG